MRPAGLPLFAIGLGIGLWCVFEFAWRGLGTPAPFDPPKQLVVSGPYRFVRNPMYVGFFLAVIGEAIAFPHLTRFMLLLLVALFIATTLFISFYEEPTLRRLFGADFEHYCANVRRWIPRLTPFDMQRTPALH
jgi:protein-S-isoprenylcysteine O-methyltransferase Ste14